MAITHLDIRYALNGIPMHGRVFRDTGWSGDQPCVLVFPEGFGLSDHTFCQAERIANLGYVAVACDLFGNGYFHNGPCPETRSRVDAILARPYGLLEIGRAAFDHAARLSGVDSDRIGAAGYCLGATIAMEMAIAGLPIRMVAAHHPSFAGLSMSHLRRMACPAHIFVGAEDYATPPAARANLEEALNGTGNAWRMTVYGSVKHSFTNPDCRSMGEKVAYDATADQHAFKAMAELMAETLA